MEAISSSRWRWKLSIAITALYFTLSWYAPYAYRAMERGLCGERGCLGSGYSTRAAWIRAAVSGPFLLDWQTPRWIDLQFGTALVRTSIFSLGVFLFWWWVGWVLDGRVIRRSVIRILFAMLGIAISRMALHEARRTFSFALLNGAGEWHWWRNLFSGPFVADALVFFVHALWMVILVIFWWVFVFRGVMSPARNVTEYPS
jgi:hypothetical protein